MIPIRVTAEITAVALAELGLTEGAPVWASVKATQIDVYRGRRPPTATRSTRGEPIRA